MGVKSSPDVTRSHSVRGRDRWASTLLTTQFRPPFDWTQQPLREVGGSCRPTSRIHIRAASLERLAGRRRRIPSRSCGRMGISRRRSISLDMASTSFEVRQSLKATRTNTGLIFPVPTSLLGVSHARPATRECATTCISIPSESVSPRSGFSTPRTSTAHSSSTRGANSSRQRIATTSARSATISRFYAATANVSSFSCKTYPFMRRSSTRRTTS